MLDSTGGGGWLKPSLLAIVFWGLWGFLTKLSGTRVPLQTMLIFLSLGTITIALIGKPDNIEFDLYHLAALASGFTCALGYLFFYKAITRGQASVVVPFTSLYVAIASILAFIILSEPITLKKLLGITFAVIAMILLSG